MAFWAYGSVELLALAVFSLFLLRYYTSDTVRWGYWVVIVVSWYLGFVGTLLLPMDVGQSQTGGEATDAMMSLWAFTYWVTFILSWVVLPVLQEFYASGEFGWQNRLKYSLKSNLKFYLVVGLLIVILIIWMAASESWTLSHVLGFLIMCANTWGIILTVFMLGYGLVEVPRLLWDKSEPSAMLLRLEFRAPDLDAQLFEARCAVDDIIADVKKLQRELPTDGPLRSAIESINRGLPDNQESTGGGSTSVNPAEFGDKELAALHRRLIYDRARLKRCQFRWDRMLQSAAEMEMIISKTTPVTATTKSKLEWWWKLKAAPIAYKVFAVGAAVMSIVVLWCELAITFGTDTHLSLYGVFVTAAGGEFLKQLLCIIPLAYMSACLYLPLFRLKLFDSMEMVGNRQTDTYSLCFNASYLCRLQFVLAYNFLRVLNLDHDTTAFSQGIGAQITLVPLMGHDFNTYVPILMIVLCLCTFFNVYSKLMRAVGVEAAGKPQKGNEEHEEILAEGRKLVRRGVTRNARDAEAGHGGGRSGGRGPSASDRSGGGAHAGAREGKLSRSYTPPQPSPTRGSSGGGTGGFTLPGKKKKGGYSQLK